MAIGLTLAVLAAGCGGGSAGSGAALTFDPCAPVALMMQAPATPEQQAGLAAAAALWNGAAGTHLTLDGPAPMPAIPVLFQAAASPDHGLYDGDRGMIFANDDLSGPQLAVTLAHEIGHAFGLLHVDASDRVSVMNPGNLSTAPTAGDAAQVATLWGACAP